MTTEDSGPAGQRSLDTILEEVRIERQAQLQHFDSLDSNRRLPDGADHWPVVYEKIKRMILDEDTLITTDELRGITAPTLIMASDDHLFRLEHTLEIYRSIPNAQLAIVPGTSHALVMEKPDVIDGLILEFLTRDPMPTMMPIRRAPAGPPV